MVTDKGDAAVLADDVRECPATWTLAASWVLVFALMHLVQWRLGIPMPDGGFANPLAISPQVGHRFGDMTWSEVRHGEVWRLITATFIHFSLVHVGMNAFGMIKLGQLMEPWYRSGPFLAVCITIGGLGNLVGGLMRQGITLGKTALVGSRVAKTWPGWFEITTGADGFDRAFSIPSGGGSTILLGLLGLGAVVGWRSKTRIGSFLRDQMITMLGFTAVLGIVLYNLIDNYGHAGGAVVGAAIGFVHRPLLRLSERSRAFRLACWAAVAVVLLACVVAATRGDRSEAGLIGDFTGTSARYRLDIATLADLEQVSILYVRNLGQTAEAGSLNELDVMALEPLLKLMSVAPPPTTAEPLDPAHQRERTQTELRAALDSLATHSAGTWGDPVAKELATITRLGRTSLTTPPDYRQTYSFVVAWRAAAQTIVLDRDSAKNHLVQLERQAQ